MRVWEVPYLPGCRCQNHPKRGQIRKVLGELEKVWPHYPSIS